MQIKRVIIFLLFVATLSMLSQGCGKCDCIESTDPCAGLSYKFLADVQPIINSHCATSPGCHAAGSINAGGPLTNYTEVFNQRLKINLAVSANSMPLPPDTLSSAQKNKIICWINSGAPDN
ncbi:MAG: hypothetical protein ABI683_03800 [Ginsengibacter sp.]